MITLTLPFFDFLLFLCRFLGGVATLESSSSMARFPSFDLGRESSHRMDWGKSVVSPAQYEIISFVLFKASV